MEQFVYLCSCLFSDAVGIGLTMQFWRIDINVFMIENGFIQEHLWQLFWLQRWLIRSRVLFGI